MEEKKDKSYVIRDKRIFSETGEIRDDETSRPDVAPAETVKKEKTETVGEQPNETTREEATVPEMNFVNFVISLGTTAMFHFGDFPDPDSHKSKKNLEAAKQTIDVLTMLKSKTKGNLDDNEESLIDGLLFELRMRYVKEKDRP